MIAGPNGCGKSALFRILAQVWPITGGILHKPPLDQLFYIPQRPYLPQGTLREQLIYPETLADQRAKGIPDSVLDEILVQVRLAYIKTREGGYESENDWNDVFSGGEK